MYYSKLFGKTNKNVGDTDSINAKLLIKGGFIHQEMAGVYTYLPLGYRVVTKINNIIREEMNAIDGQEVFMPVLHPRENWEKTGRWEGMGSILFKIENKFTLGPTHEEIVTPLVQDYTFSYKDLPVAVYQIQTKFRNEARAKSGVLRGREFGMKDLYSFHTTEEDLDRYYEIAKQAYFKIFKRLGLADYAVLTYASGGSFSQFSHEFQALSDQGEDTIYLCPKCRVAVNKEILNDYPFCPECQNKELEERRGIEIGNIFKLKTKFSGAFDFSYLDENNVKKPVQMGCYGIGPTRAMGTVVEIFNDANGIIWPKEITPYHVSLVTLGDDPKILQTAEQLYQELQQAGWEVLYDDRPLSAGIKFKDSDLIGLPVRLVLSSRTCEENKVEWKERTAQEMKLVPYSEIVDLLKKFYH